MLKYKKPNLAKNMDVTFALLAELSGEIMTRINYILQITGYSFQVGDKIDFDDMTCKFRSERDLKNITKLIPDAKKDDPNCIVLKPFYAYQIDIEDVDDSKHKDYEPLSECLGDMFIQDFFDGFQEPFLEIVKSKTNSDDFWDVVFYVKVQYLEWIEEDRYSGGWEGQNDIELIGEYTK